MLTVVYPPPIQHTIDLLLYLGRFDVNVTFSNTIFMQYFPFVVLSGCGGLWHREKDTDMPI
jgi:hypothetical protein